MDGLDVVEMRSLTDASATYRKVLRCMFQIQDVIIDEVSMIENYREQFTLIIKKSGVEGLLTKMQKKIDRQSKSKVTQ